MKPRNFVITIHKKILLKCKKMLENLEKKRKESNRMKTVKNYQCDWCRRLLQNPSGLIRHKSYCVWNPDFKAIKATREKVAEAIREKGKNFAHSWLMT